MVTSPTGLRPEKDSLARHSNNRKQRTRTLVRECLTPRQTGRLTVGRNITSTLTLTCFSLDRTARNDNMHLCYVYHSVNILHSFTSPFTHISSEPFLCKSQSFSLHCAKSFRRVGSKGMRAQRYP
jgi:hypothetical protein